MINQQTLIIGANSNIAKALVDQIQQYSNVGLILISRDLSDYSQIDNLQKITVQDYQPETISATVERLSRDRLKPITQVFICNGILHNSNIQPEKRLEELNAQSFQQVIAINALLPMLWIQQLTPLLASKSPCKIIVFSARVGSINDNKLGGWYSYRASKAALNMMLKTVAIELARRAKNIKIIAFHPGTTDTPLSKPFQRNVPPEKLFPCDFVAKQLLAITKKTEVDGSASYLDWQGNTIDW
ncbi:SDR family NAD(P)-dependent oxidoreductase [Thalassotalea piscium]|uniref:NAD(P)-dependent dehydrogenase (Short-subunit alcohol dehydrogenase family) n=1 Tax=Thalassotalea piscium TaxID=1230533 RepID=A0A7X0NI71_9GAMM|nr:SDR family NAD(P)-dependent oxidoreductase [Thalassotalea piscium]MBB6543771.1 NAD(P)-dependent dehydrogenase (short-subunit alcohol dehydrogenase family) [Thalassotalea piscium]